MPKWKDDATKFVVSVNDCGESGYVCRIPKPLIEQLGITGKIQFSKVGKRIEVSKPK